MPMFIGAILFLISEAQFNSWTLTVRVSMRDGKLD